MLSEMREGSSPVFSKHHSSLPLCTFPPLASQRKWQRTCCSGLPLLRELIMRSAGTAKNNLITGRHTSAWVGYTTQVAKDGATGGKKVNEGKVQGRLKAVFCSKTGISVSQATQGRAACLHNPSQPTGTVSLLYHNAVLHDHSTIGWSPSSWD